MDQTELEMNPEYFVGYLSLTGPIVDPPAAAAARQEVIPECAPDTTASLRAPHRIRKQVVPSIRESTNAVLPSRQQRGDTMAGQPQTRAQQRGQQAQALQASRASHQVTAAAARRAAALQTPTLPAQQQGKACLPRSVRVPKATANSNNKGALGSGGEANSGGQAQQQKPSIAPTSPPKTATRAIPSSPTSSESSNGPRFCHCCYTTDSPTWRKSGVQPYDGLPVCNACGMWEVHHCKSLTHSGKEGKHWEAFLATHGEVSAEAEETPMKAQQPTGAQVAAHQQARSIGHSHETRSSVAAREAAAARGAAAAAAEAAAAAAAAAAAIGGDGSDGSDVLQHDTLKAMERQPMQPVRSSADPGSGSQGAEGPSATHKRKAADSPLQPAANKRIAARSLDTNGAAIAMTDLNDGLEEIDPCAADAGGTHTLLGGSGTAQRRRTLRLRR